MFLRLFNADGKEWFRYDGDKLYISEPGRIVRCDRMTIECASIVQKLLADPSDEE